MPHGASTPRSPVRALRIVASLVCAGAASSASALPEAPGGTCAAYAEAPTCSGKVPECTLCHTSTSPAAWNAYGLALQAALPGRAAFSDELAAALGAIDADDADGDGFSNGDELMLGTLPGDAASRPADEAEPAHGGAPNPVYSVGSYDVAYAYRRASVLYCGASPSYAEMAPFRAPGASRDTLRAELHARIEACLGGTYWRKEGLTRLADDRIRPIRNLGQDSEVFITIPVPSLAGEVRMRSTMGDYRFDYRLWVHVLTDNRDARELLLAQYYVDEKPDGSWVITEDMVPRADSKATAGGQKLPKERRAGMITTMWFLTRNTMFTDLPRTTAAAAYRAYLGSDISKMQGLLPVAGEPDDIDDKGVAAPRCAVCHSTLDPLAYAFAPYNGFSFSPLVVLSLVALGNIDGEFGTYDAARPRARMPRWSDAEQQPYLFGQKVSSLREWAELAARSDAFARNLALVFYVHAFAREPDAAGSADFTALWQSLREDGYSANKLIHRIIDSDAFGVP
jgi:Protein of unknown function (DUF1585)